MMKTAYILVFIFMSFLTVPTVVVLIDEHTDISYVFSTAEEEQAKNNVNIEYTFNEIRANQFSIDFLSKKSLVWDKEKHNLSRYIPMLLPRLQNRHNTLGLLGNRFIRD